MEFSMWVMASLVWRELLSHRMLLLLLVCLVGMGLMAFSPDIVDSESPEKALSSGHSLIITLASLAVIFLGGTQIAIGIHDRTAMFWLTHPLPRWKFVLGKFIGSCVIGWAIVIVFGLTLAGMFAIRGIVPSGNYYLWLAADLMRVVMLAAVLTFLASGLGYMAASLIGGVVCLAGFATFILSVYAQLVGQTPTGWVLWGIYLLIPNWEHFGFGLELAGTPTYWLLLLAYTLGYAWFYTVFAILIFQWRDLK